jgi:iron complex transport system substrate-binding protein
MSAYEQGFEPMKSSLRGAQRRSNPGLRTNALDCFASLAMTKIKLAWPLALLLLASCSRGPAIAPNKIVSNNPCVDAVLAEIAAPGQIAGVSIYSHDPDSGSAQLGWAAALPAIGTGAEEIIAARPALLLTGNLASSGTNAALTRAGVKTVALGVPATVAESVAQVRLIAKAIGRQAAGEELVGRIEASTKQTSRTLKSPFVSSEIETPLKLSRCLDLTLGQVYPEQLQTTRRARHEQIDYTMHCVTPTTQSAIIWQTGGFVAGKGTLQDELLARAGFRNASTTYGLNQWDILPLETLIRNPPDVLFMPRSAKGDDAHALAMREDVLRHLQGQTRIVDFPDKLLFCGGPTIIKAMNVMRAVR